MPVHNSTASTYHPMREQLFTPPPTISNNVDRIINVHVFTLSVRAWLPGIFRFNRLFLHALAGLPFNRTPLFCIIVCNAGAWKIIIVAFVCIHRLRMVFGTLKTSTSTQSDGVPNAIILFRGPARHFNLHIVAFLLCFTPPSMMLWVFSLLLIPFFSIYSILSRLSRICLHSAIIISFGLLLIEHSTGRHSI